MKDIEKQETVTGEAFHPVSWMQKKELLVANKERRWRVKNPEADIEEFDAKTFSILYEDVAFHFSHED
jgi:hypothetical protein